MLPILQFVRGAVSEKDIVPVLTHFCIYKRRIQGANGRVAIDAPCEELGFEAVVPAERFLRAIDACRGEPKLRFTDGGKLIIERKPFRAFLPHQPITAFPLSEPSGGKKVKLVGGLLELLRRLRPFMSSDAERAWASTLYFDRKNKVALAAANTMIGMMPSVTIREDLQLPVFCVDELLRIGEEPDSYSNDEVSITFFWGSRWLRSQKIVADWPLKTARDWLSAKHRLSSIPLELTDAVERLVPFCNDPKFPVIYFKKDGLSTAPGEIQAEIKGFDLGEAAFHSSNLLAMLKGNNQMAISDKAAFFGGKDGFKGIMAILRST